MKKVFSKLISFRDDMFCNVAPLISCVLSYPWTCVYIVSCVALIWIFIGFKALLALIPFVTLLVLVQREWNQDNEKE